MTKGDAWRNSCALRVRLSTLRHWPWAVQLSVRIAAPGVPAQTLHELVHWAEAHPPVGDALRRTLSVKAPVQVG